ncbi:hypothetical protein GCM10029963_08360 [Micromonospora andamanensis]
MTETSPALTANLPTAMRIGTVGRPLPGVRIRIADDGEVHARGEVVFGGYWHNPEATRAALTEDGWLRTGDLGRIDDNGFLRITGRTKEIMVTAAGKNVAPAPIEERIRAHPLVSQVMLVADGRPYVAALVTVDPQAWTRWREQHGLPGASVSASRDDPRLRGRSRSRSTGPTGASPGPSRSRPFGSCTGISPRPTGNSPPLKIKREAVRDHFADEVAALYHGH